jgi:hypothetical protein
MTALVRTGDVGTDDTAIIAASQIVVRRLRLGVALLQDPSPP